MKGREKYYAETQISGTGDGIGLYLLLSHILDFRAVGAALIGSGGSGPSSIFVLHVWVHQNRYLPDQADQ